MSVAWLQGPLQTPFDHWQPVARIFARQSFSVAAVAQSSPTLGFVMHTGVGVQPGRHWESL